MGDYLKRWGRAMVLWTILVPGAASAAPRIAVGVNLGGPVVTVRPPMPSVGWVWVDGAYVVHPGGVLVWRPGFWAPPPVVVHRAPVVTAPVVVRSSPAVRRVVVARPTPRAVVVRR